MDVSPEMAVAYAEVYELLKYMGKEYIEKIPKGLMEMIEENQDRTCNYKIESGKPIADNMSGYGKGLVSYINLNYLATPEERVRILKKYEKYQQEIRFEQYKKMMEEEDE